MNATSQAPPRRVARNAEMLTPEPLDLTTFPNDEGYDELAIARNIPFHALGETPPLQA